MKKLILTKAIIIFTIVLFSFSAQAKEGTCGNATTVARDVYNEWIDEANQLGCLAATVASQGQIPTNQCLTVAKLADQVRRKMVKFWNTLANNKWATLGPRRWDIFAGSNALSHSGTIRGPGTRAFVQVEPMRSDKVRVSIRKVSGKAKTVVTVCKTGLKGYQKKLWSFTIPNKAPDNKLFTKEFSGVKGFIMTANFVGKSATKKMQYRIRGTRF